MTRLFQVIQKCEEWVVSWAIILIAILTVTNVFSRVLFNRPLAATQELSQFLMVLVTFIGIGYAASKGRHIRMTALYDQLNRRWRKRFMLLISSLTALLMFVLVWYAVRYVLMKASLGTVSPALRVPLYVIDVAAPVGLMLGGIQYVLTVIRNLREPEVYLSYDHRDEYEEPITAV